MTRIMGTLHANLCMLMIISPWILFGMRNFSDRKCRENQNIHFTFNNFFEESQHIWHKVEKYGTARQFTDDNIIWHIQHKIHKGTNQHIGIGPKLCSGKRPQTLY